MLLIYVIVSLIVRKRRVKWEGHVLRMKTYVIIEQSSDGPHREKDAEDAH